MADLDTRNKRASSIGFAQPSCWQLPAPTGIPSQANRQQVDFSYAGILVNSPAGTTLMTQTRAQFRFLFAKIFDRIG